MKTFLPTLFLAFIFVCCGSNHKIHLLNNLSFKVKDGEKIIPITEDIYNSYASIIEAKEIQIPLYRYIAGNNYGIYIGIPFETNFSELLCKPLFKESEPLQTKTDSSGFAYALYLKDSVYVSEYILKSGENLMYFIGCTQTTATLDSLLSQQPFSERIYK